MPYPYRRTTNLLSSCLCNLAGAPTADRHWRREKVRNRMALAKLEGWSVPRLAKHLYGGFRRRLGSESRNGKGACKECGTKRQTMAETRFRRPIMAWSNRWTRLWTDFISPINRCEGKHRIPAQGKSCYPS